MHGRWDPRGCKQLSPNAQIVTDGPDGPVGVVCDPIRVGDVAAAIRSLLELDRAAIEAFRSRCVATAQDRWNWETQTASLTALYKDLAQGLN